MKPLLIVLFGVAHFLSLTALAQEMSPEQITALLDRIAASRDGRTLGVKFRETKEMPTLARAVESSGTLTFHPPNMFRRVTADGQLVVGDGETLWMVYPAFHQCEVYHTAENKGPAALLAILPDLLQLRNLERSFRVTGTEGPQNYKLLLAPQQGWLRRLLEGVTLELGKSPLRLRQCVFRARDGTRTTTEFLDEKEVAFRAEDFRFVPPPEMTVIKLP